MLSKNFPGRKNARRIRALERIQAQLASGQKRVKRSHGFHNRFQPLVREDRARLNREADAVALRILPQAQAEAIRTKKDRSGTGKFSRA